MTVGENQDSQPIEATSESNEAPSQSAPAPVPPATNETPTAPADEAAGAAGAAEAAAPSTGEASPAAPTSAAVGPLSAAVRRTGPLAARGAGIAKPASPAVAAPAAISTEGLPGGKQKPGKRPKGDGKRERRPGGREEPNHLIPAAPSAPRVSVPSKRSPLGDELQSELEAELAATDIDALLSGSAGMPDRPAGLAEGQRVHATVLKIHDDSVFVGLGGPDEGMVPFEQFAEEPQKGQAVEVIVRAFSNDDGLFICALPGQTIDVADISDLEEGAIVEVTITGTNTGGLECTVGGAPGFMPISQISEHRVEDTSEFVGQKMICAITECNPSRGRVVLSRRAVMEREREERRKEQLEKLEAGDTLEGTVRSIKDFGAFVDLGGCDGMVHISKMSWERIKHPSEVLEEGQKVQVKIDKIDKQTGKISLSYRDLIANPWDTVDVDFPVGQVVKGTVTRIANFGAFVRLGAGIEGLIHISELAHHRVSRVNNVVNEGDEVEVKVQSIDREAQRIALSPKAALAPPADSKKADAEAEEVDEPPRELAIKPQHTGPLKGGTGKESGGERFGLRW